MADKKIKYPENVPGPYYVDTECIHCDACVLAAENHFKLLDDGHAYVFRQPENEEEVSACEEAMESCPVEAIGNDGGEMEENAGEVEENAVEDEKEPEFPSKKRNTG